MEIPFQFTHHTTKTIIIFKVQKTHIMLLQLIHIHTVQYLLDKMKGHIIKNKFQGKPLFLIGDLNINSLDYSRNTHVCDAFIYFFLNGIFPVINRPTRVTKSSATVIDHILTNTIIY